MVGHAGSPTRRPTMHVDMTLTGSKFKVKVIHLLNFRKLHFSTSVSSTVCALRSKLMGDFDSRTAITLGIGPHSSLQQFCWFLQTAYQLQ